jgi:hypothetical protein
LHIGGDEEYIPRISTLISKGAGMKKLIFAGFLASVILAVAMQAKPVLPNPILVFSGQEHYSSGGKDFVRYTYSVANYDAYPADLFAASLELPPCGTNTKSSRTWIDVFDQRGKRLYGFCALGKPADLNKIWFVLRAEETPPSWIYIEMNDRKTNTKYKSNLAETVL